jgi:hypothetical protein
MHKAISSACDKPPQFLLRPVNLTDDTATGSPGGPNNAPRLRPYGHPPHSFPLPARIPGDGLRILAGQDHLNRSGGLDREDVRPHEPGPDVRRVHVAGQSTVTGYGHRRMDVSIHRDSFDAIVFDTNSYTFSRCAPGLRQDRFVCRFTSRP